MTPVTSVVPASSINLKVYAVRKEQPVYHSEAAVTSEFGVECADRRLLLGAIPHPGVGLSLPPSLACTLPIRARPPQVGEMHGVIKKSASPSVINDAAAFWQRWADSHGCQPQITGKDS